MRIGLISDTHSYLDPKLKEYLDSCDEIWHAGDIGNLEVTDELAKWKPLRAVYGNIDNAEIRQHFPLDLKFEIQGKKIWLTHIGGYPERFTPRVRKQLTPDTCDLFICGHSHICKVMYDKKLKMLCLNPGACGNYGIHQVKTILRFSIIDANFQDLEVVEWERGTQ